MNTVNKFLSALNEIPILSQDKWSIEHQYSSGIKKWVAGIVPSQLLTRSVKQAIESIVTLCECDSFYEHFPENILTPNYGDNWGVLANYIEINNRAIAEMHADKTLNGLISSIKILPAIPPSAKSWANCVILSQIFPNIYGDEKPYGIYISSFTSSGSLVNKGFHKGDIILEFDGHKLYDSSKLSGCLNSLDEYRIGSEVEITYYCCKTNSVEKVKITLTTGE